MTGGHGVEEKIPVEELRRQVYNHESRISSLESWRNELHSQHSTKPAWVLGIISASISLLWMLATLYLSGKTP